MRRAAVAGAVVLFVLMAPASAQATTCRSTAIGADVWAVGQAKTNCTFARYAVRLAVIRARSPQNWACRVRRARSEFEPNPRVIEVRCRRGEKIVVGKYRGSA